MIIALACVGGAVSIHSLTGERASQIRKQHIVDAARLRNADSEPQNWFTGGRDQNGSYYSPLKTIDAHSVGRLGFAWQYDLGTRRGQEATPIVVDGIMYSSGTWGYVYALDAATGQELWRYDPKADYQAARNPCCDLVNRGVAVWRGRVYVAAVDGRLHALDARTGTGCGTSIPSRIIPCPIRVPERRRLPARLWSSVTADQTWVAAASAAMYPLTISRAAS